MPNFSQKCRTYAKKTIQLSNLLEKGKLKWRKKKSANENIMAACLE